MKRFWKYDNKLVKFAGTSAELKVFKDRQDHLTDDHLVDASEVAALEKEARNNEQRGKRKAEYPSIGDQLDIIMKWAATESEIKVTPEFKSIAMKCMSVKSKHPLEK